MKREEARIILKKLIEGFKTPMYSEEFKKCPYPGLVSIHEDVVEGKINSREFFDKAEDEIIASHSKLRSILK